MKVYRLTKAVILVWLRVGAWGFESWYLKAKHPNLFPPQWWCNMMCKLGKHDYDLCYMGPTGSMIECMDCLWTVQSSVDKLTGETYTKEFYSKR